MGLSERERTALRNLSDKARGAHVAWINIRDARALADLGLAMRGRDGWTITPAGAEVLLAETSKAQDRSNGPP